MESPASPAAFCGSSLDISNSTEDERRLYGLGALLVALPLQRTQAAPVVRRSNLRVPQPRLVHVLLVFVEDGDPEVVQEGALLPHGLRR